MKPSLARSSITTFGAEAAIGAATFLATPYLVRTLGIEPYGVLGLAAVLGGQLAALQLGIAPAITRLASDRRGRGESAAVSELLFSAVAVALLSALLIGVTFAIASPFAWTRALSASEGAF